MSRYRKPKPKNQSKSVKSVEVGSVGGPDSLPEIDKSDARRVSVYDPVIEQLKVFRVVNQWVMVKVPDNLTWKELRQRVQGAIKTAMESKRLTPPTGTRYQVYKPKGDEERIVIRLTAARAIPADDDVAEGED